MSQHVQRPQAEKGKIHSKNEFELCYLRHQYIRRTKTNPTKDEMAPFKPIASNMAHHTYYTYKGLFSIIGFTLEDLISIAEIHLVSFLGLFSLDKLPEKYDDFIQKHKESNDGKEPDQEGILVKNKANCTLFLKQRMEDVVRVCRQKARNIKGLPTEEYYYYQGQVKPPLILRNLVQNYEKIGYRKLDQAVYKSIRKRIIAKGVRIEEGPVFRFNNYYFVAVLVDKKSLSLEDFSGADLDPYDNIHNMNPEEILLNIDEEDILNDLKDKFLRKNKACRSRMLKNFILENSSNVHYYDEVRAARKMLKSLE